MKKKGIGFGSAWQGVNYHFGHPDVSSVQIEIGEDLKFRVRVAAADLGQGISETVTVIVSRALGDIPLDQIIMIDPDTTATPDGGATGASRQTYMTGNAALIASRNLLELLNTLSCELLDTPVSEVIFQSNIFYGRNGKTVTLADVVNEANSFGLSLQVNGTFKGPPTEQLDEKGQGFGVNQFSYATYTAEVEVDLDTGQVEVIKISTHIDAGKIIRRTGAEMQVEGGVAMALGHTLTEEFKQRDGWPITDSLTNYLIPTVLDVPLNITSAFVESSYDSSELRVKGMAELAMVAVAPAIINAIYDAVGVWVTELPATPERVLMSIKNQM
jgi:CO/xanthine dehydrogenase Mo-binding subunit